MGSREDEKDTNSTRQKKKKRNCSEGISKERKQNGDENPKKKGEREKAGQLYYGARGRRVGNRVGRWEWGKKKTRRR